MTSAWKKAVYSTRPNYSRNNLVVHIKCNRNVPTCILFCGTLIGMIRSYRELRMVFNIMWYTCIYILFLVHFLDTVCKHAPPCWSLSPFEFEGGGGTTHECDPSPRLGARCIVDYMTLSMFSIHPSTTVLGTRTHHLMLPLSGLLGKYYGN